MNYIEVWPVSNFKIVQELLFDWSLTSVQINFRSVQVRLHLKFHVICIRTDIKNAMCEVRQLPERNVKNLGLSGFKFGSLEGNLKLLQDLHTLSVPHVRFSGACSRERCKYMSLCQHPLSAVIYWCILAWLYIFLVFNWRNICCFRQNSESWGCKLIHTWRVYC